MPWDGCHLLYMRLDPSEFGEIVSKTAAPREKQQKNKDPNPIATPTWKERRVCAKPAA